MVKGYRLTPLLVLLFLLMLPDCSLAGGGPKNVLLIVNDNSPVSQFTAVYYKFKRRIPDRNVCHIRCSTDELISKTECETNIVTPIRDFINNSGLHDRLDYIVLTKGIPLKASYYDAGWYGPVSVASVLSCLGAPSIATPSTNPYGPTAYPASIVQYFTHQLSFSGKSYYIVARLDAYTEDQVHRMIDDSVNAQPQDGLFLMDGRYESDPNSYNGKANGRLRQANHDLLAAGYATYYSDSQFDSLIGEFVGGQQNVKGYFSWGSNESSYGLPAYTSNCFMPGSIADGYVSTSARSFAYPPSYGQSLLADLFPQGLSGGNGYVSEPDVRYATYPGVLFNRYTQGYNMAESFFAATPRVYWKAAIIGDPLMAPYATPPIVQLTSPDPANAVHNEMLVSATAEDSSGIKKVEFYLDDNLVATLSAPPYQFLWDTTACAEGSRHTIEAIAYENSSVFTQGVASAQYVARNSASPVSTVGQLMDLPVGTFVHLSAKTVIAGTDVFVDGAYIAETDRSAGIRVIGSFTADTGSVVDIDGDVGMVNDERVILASSVTNTAASSPVTRSVLASGGTSALRPLGMPNRYMANRGWNSGAEYAGLSVGLSNVYLLVKIWGSVVKTGTDEFWISDGSMVMKNAVVQDIKVSLKNMAVPAQVPPMGSYVFVTGVSCYTLEDGLKRPTIRPRFAGDIVQVSL